MNCKCMRCEKENIKDTEMHRCPNGLEGIFISMPHPEGIEEMIEEFATKITSCTHVGGFHTCVLDDKSEDEMYKKRATEFVRSALTTAYTSGYEKGKNEN